MASKEGRCRTMSAKRPSRSGTCSSMSRAPRLVTTAVHMLFDSEMTSTSRPLTLSVLLSITGSRPHVEQDLPARTAGGARQRADRLRVLIDCETVRDEAGGLEAAGIEE